MLPTTSRSPSGQHSIAESLTRTAGALTFVDESGGATRMSGPELAAYATTAAVRLRQRAGVRAGDRVCLLAPTTTATLVTLFGLWRLGAVPVVVAGSVRSAPDGLPARLAQRVAAAGAAAVVVEPDLGGAFASELPVPVVTTRDLQQPGAAGTPPAVPGPDQRGLLQFTSGTTGASRAVPVTQGQIVDNVRGVAEAAGLGGGTHASWLPLYHDMGIVSMAGMLTYGRNVVIMATETFARRPAAWLELVSTYHADSTAAPNFAYALAARSQQLRPRTLDLSHLRVAFNGAEPITAEAVDGTLRTFADCGMRPEALCPTYGLAEATLAVTTTRGGELARFLPPEELSTPAGVDRPTRPVASCGRPIAGTSVRIRDEHGTELPEGAVGEIYVAGPGTMPGYWRPGGAGTATVEYPGTGVVDGWLRTGDLGFLRDGELYVCGRTKDMIIVGGRNFYPEDYEQVVEQSNGMRAGHAIAFSLTGAERMVVVAECRGPADGCASVGRKLLEQFRVQFEHAPEEIVLVRPGALPRTSSGKRQRGRCRELYLAGELPAVHSIR